MELYLLMWTEDTWTMVWVLTQALDLETVLGVLGPTIIILLSVLSVCTNGGSGTLVTR